MKASKKAIQIQLNLIDKKVKELISFRNAPKPRSGWLKAIREALGISARQVADRLNITHQAVLKLEQAEIKGAATLDSIHRYADAMDCTFVYAVIPKAPYQSLDDLLEEKADKVARKILQQVSHSMRLEDQGVNVEDSEQHIQQLKNDLKKSFDHRLWDIEKNGK